MRARHAHTGNGRGLEFVASVAEWVQANRSKFQVRSYYNVKVIRV